MPDIRPIFVFALSSAIIAEGGKQRMYHRREMTLGDRYLPAKWRADIGTGSPEKKGDRP
jgi:hypothetical protein